MQKAGRLESNRPSGLNLSYACAQQLQLDGKWVVKAGGAPPQTLACKWNPGEFYRVPTQEATKTRKLQGKGFWILIIEH